MFQYSSKITFSQCDPGGVIYFAEIFNIAHLAYESFMDSSNIYDYIFSSAEYAYPIIKSEAEFIKPLNLNENISVTLEVSDLRENSFELAYKILSGTVLKAKIKTIHVCINKSDNKKSKLPAVLKDSLSNHRTV